MNFSPLRSGFQHTLAARCNTALYHQVGAARDLGVRELLFSHSKAIQPEMAGGWEKGRARDAPLEKNNMDKTVWELGAQKQQHRELQHQEKHPQSQRPSLPSSLQHSFGAATSTDQWPPVPCHQHRPMACPAAQEEAAKPVREASIRFHLCEGAHELCCPMQMFPANYFQLLLVHP